MTDLKINLIFNYAQNDVNFDINFIKLVQDYWREFNEVPTIIEQALDAIIIKYKIKQGKNLHCYFGRVV